MKKMGIVISLLLISALIIAVVMIDKVDYIHISEVMTDTDYQLYDELKNNGNLDEQNKYIITYEDPDKIRVTFANNQLMTVEYYLDKEMTQKIEGTVYLEPGDTIFMKYIESLGQNKNLHKFSRYEIFEISDEFGKERIVKIEDAEAAFTIPENFKAKEIQIVPYGEYKKGQTQLYAFCSTYENIKEAVTSGTWLKNDTEIKGSVLELGPSENYTLTYKYNTNEFFFISSSPECFNHNDGEVKFKQANSSDSDKPSEYKVELKRYLALDFTFDKKAQVILNNEIIDEKVKDFKFDTSHKIKYGDVIKIKTKGNVKIVNGDYKYVNITREESKSEDLYIYTITINASNINKAMKDKECDGATILEDVKITLPEKNKYGAVKYTVDSKEVKSSYIFKEGDELKIEYTITADGYIFSEQNAFEKLFKSKSKTETITITTEMNGKELDLEKYFKVEKEEN